MNQYQKEEMLNDTPQISRDNLAAQQKALANAVPETAEKMNRVSQLVEWLYGRQQDKDDMAFIQEIYGITDSFATLVAHYDITLQAAVAFAGQMDDYARRVSGEFNDLEDAAVCNDDTHPLLRPFADYIREQTQNDMREEAAEEAIKTATQMAYYNLFVELGERIRELSGCKDYSLIQACTALLLGNGKTETRQRRLLNAILQTMPESTASQQELLAALECSIPNPTEHQQALFAELLSTFAEQNEQEAAS